MINPEAHYPPNRYWANAPDALYKYDLEKKSLSKLSSDSLNCLQYCLSNEDSIYFSAAPIAMANSVYNIYSIHPNGKGLKKILVNAESVSLPLSK